ncbi:putative WRKY transcription factor 2 [Dorcoceras hygrometricum]|uniref:Putative WRKY transcription factor 2 n=1 Tax=Dorcoceras hygrometricum TaxID=472368 RepID=A0A2Z7DBU8_9LAMI|nr:putative WRKY transcription factor 2 [Dorcoceras hygrometricum]
MHQSHSVKEVQNDSVEQTATVLFLNQQQVKLSKISAGGVIEDISRWSYRRYQQKMLKILPIMEKLAEEETPADQSAEVAKTRFEEKRKV